MILGMSMATFVLVHVVISLIAIVAGLIVMFGMLGSNRLPGLTAIFLLFTILSSDDPGMTPVRLGDYPMPPADKPLVAIVGGSKVSTKLTILDALADKVDQLVVGGGIANTFMLAAGLSIGAGDYERFASEFERTVDELLPASARLRVDARRLPVSAPATELQSVSSGSFPALRFWWQRWSSLVVAPA